MADEQVIASVDTEHDNKQQVSSPTPASKPAKKKTKWVAAGKATAQKTHVVCEAQKR